MRHVPGYLAIYGDWRPSADRPLAAGMKLAEQALQLMNLEVCTPQLGSCLHLGSIVLLRHC